MQSAWGQGDVAGADRGVVLRAELSALGPVAVKIGQTLSQRPDILPEDVCEELKGLQTSNEPFADNLAFQVIAEEFNATGPLAPGIPVTPGCDPNGPTLFAKLSETCIASASLGQVYRGTTHDGQEIAVKVQRPDALEQCLLDGSVIIAALKAIQGRYWNGDLLAIFDLVAGGVVQELDFRHEASNCYEFGESLRFLGYVDVPKTLPELTTRRALGMEWVYGRHLSDLSPEEAMRMTYMSVEAVTAGLVLTGQVHADPHEGNIMLADDGRLVFLDFGLMSGVEDDIQEAFASGIQCVLSKDYKGLVRAFVNTGFIGTPIEWRAKESDPWQTTHPKGDCVEVMAAELKERMEACPGGGSRFGALSVVLGDMGYSWQMYTPPYIILLIRTFLTLEGIAGKVDPEFNIYEVALPWAVQRALSPSTEAGIETLRSSLVTEDNTFQWGRVLDLIEQQKVQEAEEAAEAAAKAAGEGKDLPEAASARARLMAGEANKATLDTTLASASAAAQAAQAATPLESLVTVLGSAQGTTLRRIARDIDAKEMLLELGKPAAQPVRRMAVDQLADALTVAAAETLRPILRRLPWRAKTDGNELAASLDSLGEACGETCGVDANALQPWPQSAQARIVRSRVRSRARSTGNKLLRLQASNLVGEGWRGVAAVCTLVLVTWRVLAAAVLRVVLRALPAPAAAAAAAAAVYAAVAAVPRPLFAAVGAATAAALAYRARPQPE